MAQLTGPDARLDGSQLAFEQFLAIAWLRWRILANSFRRKGGAGELIGRILLLPVFAAISLLPTVAAGFFAWYFTYQNQLGRIAWVLWAAFALTQLLNINLGQPGTTFDPTDLIRFPMPLGRFVLIRLCFGLLSPANLIVSLMSVAVVVGVTIERPHLFFAVFFAMLVFVLANVLFTRMIFAWIDRWLSTRRAREIFTAFIFIGSLGLQYLNVRFNPGFQHNHYRHHARTDTQDLNPMRRRMQRVHAYVKWLPPELTAGAIRASAEDRPLIWFTDTAACGCFAVLFLGVYALRMRTEFRGENLSDAANAVSQSADRRNRPAATSVHPLATPAVSADQGRRPTPFSALLAKELLTLRRNVGLFYGIVAPAVMVFLFAGRFSTRSDSHWVLLGAVAYALLGIAPMSYNTFGLEGTGAQFYFFAPVPLREVFFAKNIFGFLLALTEVVVIVAITSYVVGRPHLADCIFALLWATGTLLFNTTLGNLRSVSAPKQVKPGRSMSKAQSAVSGYIAMGILLGCAALGYGSELLAIYLQREWIGLALMAAFAAGGALVYDQGLRGIEAYALQHRDTLFEELGKKI